VHNGTGGIGGPLFTQVYGCIRTNPAPLSRTFVKPRVERKLTHKQRERRETTGRKRVTSSNCGSGATFRLTARSFLGVRTAALFVHTVLVAPPSLFVSGPISHCSLNPQIENFQLVNRAFYQVMAQMCARNLRKNEFATNIQASKINVDDTVSTYRDGFLAWMVSGRPKPPVNKFEKFFIWAKTSSVRYLLEASRTISAYRSSIQKLCQREIFSPRLLGGLKMDVASLSGQILIGSEDEVDEGMSANLTYTKIERAAQEFAMMKLPKGTGTAFIVDLLIMSDASKSEVHAAVLKITQIIQEHLDNEIQKLPLFHSWKVFAYKVGASPNALL